jgi:hypothetical protein
MRPIDILLRDAIACYQEHFVLILEELRSRTKHKSLLVEGTSLLPSQVAAFLPSRSNAIWVVPTEEFQKQYYSRREWAKAIVQQCDEPQAAFENWMERDVRFARWVVEEARALNLELLQVDGRRTIEENATVIATHYGFSPEG